MTGEETAMRRRHTSDIGHWFAMTRETTDAWVPEVKPWNPFPMIPSFAAWRTRAIRPGSDNDHRMAKSIENTIDFAAKRQVWQRMIL